MLLQLVKLPVIILGDFNIRLIDFKQSGWLTKFRVVPKEIPGATTTLSSATNSLIDFCLVSIELSDFIVSVMLVKGLPWAPHFGLLVQLNDRPRQLNANVLVSPCALPMELFNTEWNKLDTSQQQDMFNKASTKAKRMLKKQKLKTGFAILGKPNTVLNNDPKFQGKLKQDCIDNGEYLAFSSLSSELLVLAVAEVPRLQWHKYIGRGQYPKIVNKPIISKNNVPEPSILEKHEVFRNAIKGVIC